MDIDQLLPSDDTGSVTYARYKYQVKLCFPMCLDIALNGEIIAIYLEHGEDIVVSRADGTIFIQVKTREPHLRHWTNSELIDGPLSSLARAFRDASGILNPAFVMALEGRVDEECDLVRYLRSRNTEPKPDLVLKVASKTGLTEDQVKAFLPRVRCRDRMPSREAIDGRNHQVLRSVAPSMSGSDAESLYEQTLSLLDKAMMGDAESVAFHVQICDPGASSAPAHAKMVTHAKLATAMAKLGAGQASRLLARVNDIDLPGMTILEAKLLAGGADDETIRSAKRLRASEASHEAELLSGIAIGITDDLVERLVIRHNAIRSGAAMTEAPAIAIWSELLRVSEDSWRQTDPRRILRADGYLLIGKICALADECVVDFGAAKDD